jgi:uncharacterized Rmd1/YagE family protein
MITINYLIKASLGHLRSYPRTISLRNELNFRFYSKTTTSSTQIDNNDIKIQTKTVSNNLKNQLLSFQNDNNVQMKPKKLSFSPSTQMVKKKLLNKKNSIIRDENTSTQASIYDIDAMATADYYNIQKLQQAFKTSQQYEIIQLDNALFDTWLCIRQKQTEPHIQINEKTAFLYEDGIVVFWNMTKGEKENILQIISNYSIKNYSSDLISEYSETMTFSQLEPSLAETNKSNFVK